MEAQNAGFGAWALAFLHIFLIYRDKHEPQIHFCMALGGYFEKYDPLFFPVC